MDYDLIIIGSGPAGYVAAIRAGQVGLKTAIIEKEHIGGMCLNWGCIPTKALLESARRFKEIHESELFGIDGIEQDKLKFNWANAMRRAERITKKLAKGVEYLLKKNGVDLINSIASIHSGNSVNVEKRIIEAENIIIATGSKPAQIKSQIAEGKLIGIQELLRLNDIPEKIVLIGQGPNAIEIAQALAFIGKKVSILVPDSDLLPGTDAFIHDYATSRMEKDGVDVHFNIDPGKIKGDKISINDKEIKFDLTINISRRTAILPDSKIEFASENGFLKVNEFLQTNHPDIYAVGDVNGISSLAHAASAQGLYAVNSIKGLRKPIDHSKYPLNIYTYPEIAQIGLMEMQLQEKGIEYKISEFPLSANGKAMCEGQTEGKVRLISEPKYGEVLGVQIIAQHATDMIAEAAALMTIEGTVFDLASVIHAHPTVSEIFMEAGFAAVDKAIHI